MCLTIPALFFPAKTSGHSQDPLSDSQIPHYADVYPHDTPTHLLENPQQYITRAGRILRKTSLDELPQIFQIFTGKMAVIGPRPALWNQYDLIAQRDLYGANDVRPGLTGWAQINGRDELPRCSHQFRRDRRVRKSPVHMEHLGNRGAGDVPVRKKMHGCKVSDGQLWPFTKDCLS